MIISKFTIEGFTSFNKPVVIIDKSEKKKSLFWLIGLVLFPVIFTQLFSILKQSDFFKVNSMYGLIGTILLLVFLILILIFMTRKDNT